MHALQFLRTPTCCLATTIAFTSATLAGDCASILRNQDRPSIAQLKDGQLLIISLVALHMSASDPKRTSSSALV